MFKILTLVAATEALEGLTQAEFDQLLIRLNLEHEIPVGAESSVQKKCALLARIVKSQFESPLETFEGSSTLGEAVVREAVKSLREESSWRPQETFIQVLASDGFLIEWREEGSHELRPCFPVELASESYDEVTDLLEEFEFVTAQGHLDQALSAYSRSDWAASNGQLRTFVESLLDDIAALLIPDDVGGRTPENKRALLGEIGFLSRERNEWSPDGKNFINGLIKLLHTEGAHSGLSDADHCTFRLHLVLVTARMLLRRLQSWDQ